MTTYDVIIVLGSQPNTDTWKFPKQIYDCLDKTKELFDKGTAPLIATSGKWGILVDAQNLIQPFKECDGLAEYLVKKGVPDDQIYRECDSQDTISNLYYLKINLLIPRNLTNLLLVVAEFRIPRLEFLSSRILGAQYSVAFEPIKSETGSTYNEPNTLRVQSKFLEPMRPGDHAWLEDKFYDAPMYHYWTKHNKALTD